jgi:hypothetical protein
MKILVVVNPLAETEGVEADPATELTELAEVVVK